VAFLVAAALVARSTALHERVLALLEGVEPIVDAHPVAGAAVFMAAAALSAMLVLVSSVVLVPVGVQAWGTAGCVVLLWIGWFVGGVIAYAIGRGLGRPVVERLVPPAKLAHYEARIPARRSFWTALTIQLALQSDIAGYLFGLLAFPMWTSLGAVALVELLYAVATVFLGVAFVRGQSIFLLAFAALGGVLLWRTIRRGRSDGARVAGP
jgi:uncharacterized membrane protein YdjX (TVP38/TMEM64 family)